jgi:hypothetical protein
MSERWFCVIDGQQIGPVPYSRLRQLATAGRLKAEHYVRAESAVDWTSVAEIQDLLEPLVVTQDAAESPVKAAKRMADSQSLPRAKALETTTASLPTGIPVGSAVASARQTTSPPPAPLFVTDAAPAGGARLAAGSQQGKRKKNNGPLLIGGGAVVALAGIVVLLVLTGMINFGGKAETETANAPPKAATKAPPARKDDEEEANPEAAEPEAIAPKPSDARAAKGKKQQPAGVEAQLSKVTRWFDGSKPGIKTGGLKLGVAGLWLSSTAEGTPYVAPEEGEDSATAAPQYLVVKVKIENAVGAAPIDYRGWNDEAFLVDDAGKVAKPLDKVPDSAGAQKISAGRTLVDTLVFKLSQSDFEKLRLVLPHATVGLKDDKSFGFELPKHALGTGLEGTTLAANKLKPAIAARVAGDATPGEIVAGDDEAMADEMPAKPGVAAAVTKPKDDEDDITRKLEARARELDKMEKK